MASTSSVRRSTKDVAVFELVLVEDDEDHALLFQRALAKAEIDLNVRWMPDGEQALAYLADSAVGRCPRPDLVVLDLKLPGRSGLEVLKEIRANPEFNRVPVVVLSTSGTDRDLKAAYAHRANGYVVKPAQPEAYRQMVRELSAYWSRWNKSA